MIFQLGSRILRTTDTRLLMKMAWNFGFKGARSVQLFKKRLKHGGELERVELDEMNLRKTTHAFATSCPRRWRSRTRRSGVGS